MSKNKSSTPILTLNDPEEEEENFRELIRSKLVNAWIETKFQQRLVRGLTSDELLEITTSSVAFFAAETILDELVMTRSEFLDFMGAMFDEASSVLAEEREDEEEEDELTEADSAVQKSIQKMFDRGATVVIADESHKLDGNHMDDEDEDDDDEPVDPHGLP